MRPQFIYFDVGNVLCYFSRDREVQQVVEVSGVGAQRVREVILGEHGILWRYEAGELDHRQFYEEFCQATDSRPEMAAFLAADADIFTLNGSIVPLVAQLEDAQIPLGILSNTSQSHWRHLNDGRYAIVHMPFRRTVLSFEVGATKPDKRIFTRAIEAAGVAPERIFYVDDLAGHVAAARSLGIDAVQYTSTDALEQELLKRGVRSNF